MSQPTEAPDEPISDPASQRLLGRLRLAALKIPGLGAAISAVDAGLGEILIVVLLLISMPLALLLIVGAFQFGGLPGGFILLGLLALIAIVWFRRTRRP